MKKHDTYFNWARQKPRQMRIKLTWKTVTNAQNNVSKFARDVTIFPSSSGNWYLPPNKCMPRILDVKMNKASKARNVMTLSRVLTITESCRCNAGMKRTSLKIRRRRNERRTEMPLVSFTAKISIKLKEKSIKKLRTHDDSWLLTEGSYGRRVG